MSKFKAGDKFVNRNGNTGTIIGKDSKDRYAVIFDDKRLNTYKVREGSIVFSKYGVADYFVGAIIYNVPIKEGYLEHYKVIYNRLAEKLYPKGKRDGKWWVLHE